MAVHRLQEPSNWRPCFTWFVQNEVQHLKVHVFYDHVLQHAVHVFHILVQNLQKNTLFSDEIVQVFHRNRPIVQSPGNATSQSNVNN